MLLCLHGFPDHAQSFKPQLEAFSALGFRAVAPAMRGYAPNPLPTPANFQTATLALDVVGLIDALGDGPAVLVGHDWGAHAAYGAAVLAPEKVAGLITLAVPYGPGFRNALLIDAQQQRRSWYMFFFQTPIAVRAFAHNDFAFVEQLWADWSPGWEPEPVTMRALRASFAAPGVAEAVLSYYRDALMSERKLPALAAIQARLGRDPVHVCALYLHGENDGCISASTGAGMEQLFPNGLRRLVVAGAGHFLHLEQPGLVNDHIARYLLGDRPLPTS